MTTAAKSGQNEKITALYCRLSQDDIPDEKTKKAKHQTADESNSIVNQKRMLLDYCKKNGYTNTMLFVDDGISGTTFDRPDFQRMEAMIEAGQVSTVIVKDLSASAETIWKPDSTLRLSTRHWVCALSPFRKM